MRAVLVVLIVLGGAGQALAGHRCIRTFQTLKSSYGWSRSQGCYSCHQTSAQSYTHQRYQSSDVAGILGGLAKKQTEYQTLLAGLEKLGFQPAAGPNYQITSGTYTEGHGNYAQQGQSIYATNPQIDVMALGAMSERLASQAQGFASSATLGAQDLIGQAQRVAEIQASGMAAAAALQAAGSAAGPSFRKLEFQATATSGTAEAPAGIAAPQAASTDLATIIQTSCQACHNAGKAGGGVDFESFANLPAERQGEILQESFRRVIAADPAERMPKGKPELSLEQKAAFAAALFGGATQ